MKAFSGLARQPGLERSRFQRKKLQRDEPQFYGTLFSQALPDSRQDAELWRAKVIGNIAKNRRYMIKSAKVQHRYHWKPAEGEEK